MDKDQKKRFVKYLMASVEKDLLARIDDDKIPSGWREVEMRWYLEDWFRSGSPKGEIKKSTRRKNYLNDLRINDI